MSDKYTSKEQIAQLQNELNVERLRLAEKKVNIRRKKVLRIFNWFIFIFLFISLSIVLVSVLTAKFNGKTPDVFGYQLYVVQSGSMEPTFNVGTIILCRIPADPLALSKGDVVTFTDDGMTITHRIIEVINDNGVIKYKTKGDNPENAVDLDLLTGDRIKAVFVFRIPLI